MSGFDIVVKIIENVWFDSVEEVDCLYIKLIIIYILTLYYLKRCHRVEVVIVSYFPVCLKSSGREE